MAEVPNFGGATSGLTTNASTSVWVDYITYTFEDTDQEAGAVYAVFWSGIMSGNSSSFDYKFRVVEDSTTKFGLNVEPREVSGPQDLDSCCGFFIFTAAGTPVDTTFKLQILAEGGTAQMTEGRVRIVKLPAGSVYVESAAQASFTTTTFADKSGASISLSGPQDYLIFFSAEAIMDAVTEAIEVGINVDGTVQNTSVVGTGVSDAANVVGLFKALKISGTSTAKVQAKQSAGTANPVRLQNVRLLAMPASAFRASYYGARSSLSASSSATYVDALTLTETVQAGQHLIFANFNNKGQSTAISTYAQLLSNGVATCETVRESANISGSYVGGVSSSVERRENLTAGSNTWKIQQKSETSSATSNIFAGAGILVVDLESTTIVATGTTFRSGSPTFGSASLTQKHTLAGANFRSSSPVFATPTLTQKHTLTGQNFRSGSPVFGAPTLSGGGATLSPQNFRSGSPVFGSPSLLQRHTLAVENFRLSQAQFGLASLVIISNLAPANFRSGSPTFGSPAITQAHSLTPANFRSSSPTFGPITITQKHVLAGQNFRSSSPTFGSPVATQVQLLFGANFRSGSPVFSSAPLLTTYVFSAQSFRSGSPTFGLPSLTQGHVLAGLNFRSGSPIFDTESVVGAQPAIYPNLQPIKINWLDERFPPRFLQPGEPA